MPSDAAALVPAVLPCVPDALRPELEAAAGYVADAKAASTRRAYAADWSAFTAWCDERGVAPLPAEPAIVAAYLAGLADHGRKVSSIERALAGIAHAHRAAGQPWQKGHPGVREVVKGIRRTLGVAPTQKAPVTDDELRALVAALDGPAAVRDRALLLVGWFGAFRRSELVALTVADVTFAAEGLIVRVRRSKVDQEGKGSAKGLPFAGDPSLCPVRALRGWLEVSGATDGPVFRRIDKAGNIGAAALTGAAVALVVKRAAESAGLDAERFAGHSLRAGFATTAAKRGRDLSSIMRQTGHKSERVARGYVRHANLFTANAAAGLL